MCSQRKYLIWMDDYFYYKNIFSKKNYDIYKDYISNIKASDIAEKYKLSKATVYDIARETYLIILQINNLKLNAIKIW